MVVIYYFWNCDKQLEARRDGDEYIVSPWMLHWDGSNYYLIGFDDREEEIRFYRVDKMKYIYSVPEPRVGRENYLTIDFSKLSSKTFNMFAGEERRISLRLKKHLIGVFLDRFGSSLPITNKTESTVDTSIIVAISEPFFGWILGFGDGIQILGPPEVSNELCEYINKIKHLYC